ncbi:glycine-rich cell wall structural protein 1.8-like [Rhopalosiphum maidis]|uniref:glycine-rich cell wall structural protein 1.8-like n=1 Tax=Rhopalosiphum maidis TaxID=43146 RepID=UPI000EFDD526|nr:glycine-rich cell wall structural protein 1.8-like [Rhopalosiphum maidis]
MFLVLIYCISLSILQITGVSVTWNSPASRIYSSINSKSVPIYNGHLEQQSSTIQPFSISGGTLTSLNANQIDNVEMSSNRDLGLNTNKILVSQDGQLRDNNGDGVSENTITNTGPSGINGGSTKSSTNIQNFDIPVQVKGPELSSIYHGINKNSETNRINDVSKLYESSDIDRGFQLGRLGVLSGSNIEDGTNISGGEYRKSSGVIEKIKTAEEMKDTDTAVQLNDLNLLKSSGELNEKNRVHKVKRGKGVNENREEGKDRELSGLNGSIRFDRKNEDRISKSGEKEEEEGRGFNGSVGSMQFGKQNEDRAGGSGGEEEGEEEEEEGRGFSGSKGSIRFGGNNGGRFEETGRKEGGIGFSGSKGSIKFDGNNDGRFGGMGGEEGGIGFSGSKGSIKFDGNNDGRFGGMGGEEGGIGFSGSKGSIRFGGNNDDRFGGMGGEEEGTGFSGSKGSIRYGGKNDGRFGGMGGGEGGIGFSGSKGSMRFGGNNGGRFEGSGRKEGGIGFSGSKGSIRFGGNNGGRFGGMGGEEGGIGFSGSKGSIRYGGKNDGRFGGMGGGEGGIGFSGSKGSMRFGGNNGGRFGGMGGGEGGIGFSGSKGSMRFGGNNGGRFEGSGRKEGGIGFNGSKGSIRFGGTNKGKTNRSGGGNIKIGGGRIARRLSKLRDIGKVNRGGEKGNFGGSVGGIQFSNENGDKESNTVNIKMTGGNYGSGRFGGNIKSNSFEGDSGMIEVGGSRSFGERNMFSKTGGNY